MEKQFFQTIAEILGKGVSVVIAISAMEDENIAVSISPKGKHTFTPLTIVGKAEELDAEIVKELNEQMIPAVGLIVSSKNYEEVVKDELAKEEDEDDDEKPVSGNKSKKGPVKKGGKNIPAKKPAPQPPAKPVSGLKTTAPAPAPPVAATTTAPVPAPVAQTTQPAPATIPPVEKVVVEEKPIEEPAKVPADEEIADENGGLSLF